MSAPETTRDRCICEGCTCTADLETSMEQVTLALVEDGKRIAELEALLRELSLGQSIHNSRFPDRKIEGPLWDRVSAALKPPTT
jgi:hypothetical protein